MSRRRRKDDRDEDENSYSSDSSATSSGSESSSSSSYDSTSSGSSDSSYSSSSSVSNDSKLVKQKDSRDENIKVFVRIRPLLGKESNSNIAIKCTDSKGTEVKGNSGKLVIVDTENHHVEAGFDGVFGPDCSQSDVYESVGFCVNSVLLGFNSTLFAYGQTGSGKTFTLFGPEDDPNLYATGADPSKNTGIIPRAVRQVLQGCKLMPSTQQHNSNNSSALNSSRSTQTNGPDTGQDDDAEFSVYCSFMQVYNDNVYDLLRDPQRGNSLSVHETTKGDVYVEGISEYPVHSLHECLTLLERGDEYRACRQTHMNDVSSRSHSIFQLTIECRRPGGRLTKSKLNLVDLAGSEKWDIRESMGNDHVSELTNINSSLHTLGRCIAALTDPKATHVPFRDSKLTRILMDSLGGNARASIIATLSPCERSVEEGISTLKFADRAMRVMQHAVVTETREINLELVRKLELEITQLRQLLSAATGKDWSKTKLNSKSIKAMTSSSEANESADAPSTTGNNSKISNIEQSMRVAELEEALRVSNNEIQKLRESKATSVPSTPRLISHQESAEKQSSDSIELKKALIDVRTCTQQFFNLEIEESGFQQLFQRAIGSVEHLLASEQPVPHRRRKRSSVLDQLSKLQQASSSVSNTGVSGSSCKRNNSNSHKNSNNKADTQHEVVVDTYEEAKLCDEGSTCKSATSNPDNNTTTTPIENYTITKPLHNTSTQPPNRNKHDNSTTTKPLNNTSTQLPNHNPNKHDSNNDNTTDSNENSEIGKLLQLSIQLGRRISPRQKQCTESKENGGDCKTLKVESGPSKPRTPQLPPRPTSSSLRTPRLTPRDSSNHGTEHTPQPKMPGPPLGSGNTMRRRRRSSDTLKRSGNINTSSGGEVFRVRGRREAKTVECPSEETVIEARLQEHRRKLKKQQKLQAWYSRKAQRELAKVSKEQEDYRLAIEQQKQERENWAKHTEQVKRRLAKLQQDEKNNVSSVFIPVASTLSRAPSPRIPSPIVRQQDPRTPLQSIQQRSSSSTKRPRSNRSSTSNSSVVAGQTYAPMNHSSQDNMAGFIDNKPGSKIVYLGE